MLSIRSRTLAAAVASTLIPLSLATAAAADDAKPTQAAASEAGQPSGDSADRVALSTTAPAAAAPAAANREALKPDFAARADQSLHLASPLSPIARAVQTMDDCRARFEKVDDYTCTFYKRERIDGVLSPLHVMDMKMRTDPHSVYLKFHQPNRGREAIYVSGRNDGLILAHDVGFTKLLAGTMRLDPKGSRAMTDNRHPITDAGIGNLIETVARRWSEELHSSEAVVLFDSRLKLGSAHCLLVEAIHPQKRPNFVFHKVRLFINTDLGLPIRFEGYDWPAAAGDAPELVEEYIYDNIKINVGLDDADFDAANKLYSFGRF